MTKKNEVEEAAKQVVTSAPPLEERVLALENMTADIEGRFINVLAVIEASRRANEARDKATDERAERYTLANETIAYAQTKLVPMNPIAADQRDIAKTGAMEKYAEAALKQAEAALILARAMEDIAQSITSLAKNYSEYADPMRQSNI